MSFDDVFTASDDAAIMDALGNELFYGTEPIQGIVDYKLQDVGMRDAYTTVTGIDITVLKTAVPGVKRGSQFTHLGKRIVVDAAVGETATHFTLACHYG